MRYALELTLLMLLLYAYYNVTIRYAYYNVTIYDYYNVTI